TTNNKLELVEDGDSKNVADFTYLNGAAGKVARIKTSDGNLGYHYNTTDCEGNPGSSSLNVYYNDTDDTDASCDSDGDCGGANLCGGETTPGTGNTGV